MRKYFDFLTTIFLTPLLACQQFLNIFFNNIDNFNKLLTISLAFDILDNIDIFTILAICNSPNFLDSYNSFSNLDEFIILGFINNSIVCIILDIINNFDCLIILDIINNSIGFSSLDILITLVMIVNLSSVSSFTTFSKSNSFRQVYHCRVYDSKVRRLTRFVSSFVVRQCPGVSSSVHQVHYSRPRTPGISPSRLVSRLPYGSSVALQG